MQSTAQPVENDTPTALDPTAQTTEARFVPQHSTGWETNATANDISLQAANSRQPPDAVPYLLQQVGGSGSSMQQNPGMAPPSLPAMNSTNYYVGNGTNSMDPTPSESRDSGASSEQPIDAERPNKRRRLQYVE